MPRILFAPLPLAMRLLPCLLLFLCAVIYSAKAYSKSIEQQLTDNEQTKAPLRIIALAPHVVELLHDIGAYSLLVATIEHADYPSKAQQLPRVGNYAQLQIEKIIRLQPDLIIAWQDSGLSHDLHTLEKYGFRIVYSAPKNLADISDELRWLGKLTGYQQQANARADQYSKKLQQLAKTYQNKAPVSVFYELWANPLTTVAGNGWLQQQLTLCGASNPFSHVLADYPQVNIEHVIQANPQVIIQPTSAGNLPINRTHWQRYPVLDAVRFQQILHPNSDILHRMSFRLLGELAKTCKQIDAARMFYQGLQ